MEDSEMTPLAAALDRRLEETETAYHRPLYFELDWDDRLVCIKGAKGTGKTTICGTQSVLSASGRLPR